MIGVPLLLVMVLFALSNREPLRIGLFPLGQLPGIPACVIILLALGLGYFLGGLRVRIAELRHRRAAKHAQQAMRLMEAKHQEVRLSPGAGATSRG
jgi:putative membrane protein